jgi:GNAT superfamily N-acetyltransferase
VKGVQFPDGFALEPLRKQHPRAAFRSGKEAVDRYLAERALQGQEKRLSSTRVLVETDAGTLAGYYTLSMGLVGFADLPAELSGKLPRRELPAAVLAWLGVDRKFQGRGFGARLLAHALRDCWEASQTFPFIAVVLDCLDEATRGFYLRWDFQELPGHPLRLYLSANHLEVLMKRPA